MKKLNEHSETQLTKGLTAATPFFNAKTLAEIQKMIEECVTVEQLDRFNRQLSEQNRRKLEYDDIARIAYVHSRSIRENEGYSPYARIITYNSKNGRDYDNVHVRHTTELLLAIEFIVLLAPENRKANKCRKYTVPEDVQVRIRNAVSEVKELSSTPSSHT